MNNLADTYSRIRSGIVAFAPKYPHLLNPSFKDLPHLSWIIGTGFIVGDSLVATNRHVVEGFKTLPKPSGADDVPAVALLFSRTSAGLGICALNVCDAVFITAVGNSEARYATQLPDVAVVSLNCLGLDKHRLGLSSERAVVGTEIATAGFPLGTTLLAPYGELERFGPVLQRGIVAAESPFQGAEPHAYLIDVMVQAGASGSPVFRIDNGQVIGIVYASQLDPTDVQTQKSVINIGLPTSLSYVVPSTLLNKLLESASTQLLDRMPPRSPSIEEILAQMPSEPQEKITSGYFTHSTDPLP